MEETWGMGKLYNGKLENCKVCLIADCCQEEVEEVIEVVHVIALRNIIVNSCDLQITEKLRKQAIMLHIISMVTNQRRVCSGQLFIIKSSKSFSVIVGWWLQRLKVRVVRLCVLCEYTKPFIPIFYYSLIWGRLIASGNSIDLIFTTKNFSIIRIAICIFTIFMRFWLLEHNNYVSDERITTQTSLMF